MDYFQQALESPFARAIVGQWLMFAFTMFVVIGGIIVVKPWQAWKQGG